MDCASRCGQDQNGPLLFEGVRYFHRNMRDRQSLECTQSEVRPPQLAASFSSSESDVAYWHKTDLPMQSPHVRCWGNNGSRISVLRLVFRRRRLARARGKLEQRCSRALASLLALLADQPPGEVVDACRRHVGQGA